MQIFTEMTHRLEELPAEVMASIQMPIPHDLKHVQQTPPSERFLEGLIPTRMWKLWDMRLKDWLINELDVPKELAIIITKKAIAEGFENDEQ